MLFAQRAGCQRDQEPEGRGARLGELTPSTKQTAGTRGRFLRRYSACMPRVQPTADTRRTNAEMHPMTQASSGTPHTKQMAGTRGRFLRRYSACMPRVRPTADTRRTTAEMHPMTQASSGTPHTKPVAGAGTRAHSLSAITRITFGIIDIERTLLPYFSLTAPIVRFQSGSNQVPMRFQWR